MHKKLAALILTAATALTLTGCSAQNPADNPAQGRWVTATDKATDKAVGDVWCIDASAAYGTASFDCQWSSLTAPGTHKDAVQASGEYRYIMAADQREHKVFCIDYMLRKNPNVTTCNWSSLGAR